MNSRDRLDGSDFDDADVELTIPVGDLAIMQFDPYHKWLSIPPAEQPAHHYRLLGVAPFESDSDVIEGAADRQMAHVRTFQSGQHSALSQQVLNELAAAKLCLLNPQKKAAYDAELRRRMDARQVREQQGAAPQLASPPSPHRAVPIALPVSKAAFNSSPDLETPVIDTDLDLRGPSRRWQLYIATCLASLVVMLGIAVVVRTPRGTAEVERSDRNADVTVGLARGGATLVIHWPAEERLESEVLINGIPELIPEEDPFEIPLAPGKHHVVLRRSGYDPIEWNLDLAHGSREEKRVAWAVIVEVPSKIDKQPTDETSVPPASDGLAPGERQSANSAPVVPDDPPSVPDQTTGSTAESLPPEPQSPPQDDCGQPPDVMGTVADIGDDAFQKWLNDVDGLPAEQLAAAVVKKLRELNPGLPAKRTSHQISDGAVTEFTISSPIVKDLLPLRAFRRLKSLTFSGTGARGVRLLLADLSPLAGMSLTHLACRHTRVTDLSPLKGMPLMHLDCSNTDVSDLSPLEGMPLRSLNCARTKVADLSPLRRSSITNLDVSQTPITDLSPLKGVPLSELNCSATQISDLSPLRGSPLKNLNFSNTRVSDHSPLLEMPMLLAMPLRGRAEGARALLLGKYGGNADSEAAVASGLAWLARNQRKDGTWSLKGPYRSGATAGPDVPQAATAMALLAFLGTGNTQQSGEYKNQVVAGRQALLRMQATDGNFIHEGQATNHWFYAQGQCTITVCELYAMTKDPELKRRAELAVKFCIESQDPELGGWKYMPRKGSDTSVTGCILMALQTAQMAGLEVPETVLQRASGYLDKATPDGRLYAYEVNSEPTVAMTAEALLCRQLLGWQRDDPRLVQGVESLIKNLPRDEDRDLYYWYYATRVMHNMQGKYWTDWNGALRDKLVKSQETSGPEKGSWEPLGKYPDRWSKQGQGMRLYTTCLSIYMLQAYYRHLPIYGVDRIVAASAQHRNARRPAAADTAVSEF